MARVMIGTDPHKRSATIEVRDEREILLATGRFGMDRPAIGSCWGMCGSGRRGCGRWRARNGVGRPLAASAARRRGDRG